MEMLEQVVARKQTTALMIITCETLRDTAGVLKRGATRNSAADAGGKTQIGTVATYDPRAD